MPPDAIAPMVVNPMGGRTFERGSKCGGCGGCGGGGGGGRTVERGSKQMLLSSAACIRVMHDGRIGIGVPHR